jgi:hypothetical protein
MPADRDMETLTSRARAGGQAIGRLATRAAWAARTARGLPARLKQLEQDVHETRRLHQRVAELTDVVAEILVPAADRDDDRIRAVLARYHQSSFSPTAAEPAEPS